MGKFLRGNGISIYSAENEGKSVIAEECCRMILKVYGINVKRYADKMGHIVLHEIIPGIVQRR